MSATNQPINKWYSILKLQDMLSLPELDGKLLNLAKTQGFVTAMASAPNVLNPQEWLPFLWGGEETAPFSDGEQLELYIDEIVQMWNQTRPALLEGSCNGLKVVLSMSKTLSQQVLVISVKVYFKVGN